MLSTIIQLDLNLNGESLRASDLSEVLLLQQNHETADHFLQLRKTYFQVWLMMT